MISVTRSPWRIGFLDIETMNFGIFFELAERSVLVGYADVAFTSVARRHRTQHMEPACPHAVPLQAHVAFIEQRCEIATRRCEEAAGSLRTPMVRGYASGVLRRVAQMRP